MFLLINFAKFQQIILKYYETLLYNWKTKMVSDDISKNAKKFSLFPAVQIFCENTLSWPPFCLYFYFYVLLPASHRIASK